MASALTAAEIDECREAFTMFDKDGDDLISPSEVSVVVRSLGKNPTERQLQDMVAKLKKDAHGKISFEEFKKLMVEAKKYGPNEAELMGAFKVFDREDNGSISVPEMRHMMTHLGEKLTEEECTELLATADRRNTGQIDYQEFTRMLMIK